MSGSSILFEPHLPLWAILLPAILMLALILWGFWRRAKGTLFRLALAALLVLALLNPVLRQEKREPLDDVVVLATDRSASQRLPGRPEQTDAALNALRERLAQIPGLAVETVEIDGDTGGTRLIGPLTEAMAGLERSRLAGVILLTDGQIHDAPARGAGPLDRPLHVLLTGRPGEVDRRIAVQSAPGFAMVGEPQKLVLSIDDLGAEPGQPAELTVRRDGRVMAQMPVRAGDHPEIPFTLDRAGRTVLEAEVSVRTGELTTLNNRVAIPVAGVRDRLRVLLVSGQPYPGLRVWRNLLKADPAVDLVHFTILRPPEKQDGTPIRELALIAFPSRELFEVKLDDFDLVIFDRYNRRGLLPLPYLENVARYVERGGAVLEAAGPEFATPTSLYRTPLARILPGSPTGEVVERPFKPMLTELGRRHPVTRGLVDDPANPSWGEWFRLVDVDPGDAQVPLTGANDRPLMLLKRVGEGRVAQLLSDQAWLWARGIEGGGPQAQLLRRLVHWLMKEPELEEEALSAEPAGNGIAIVRRTLDDQPLDVTVTSPDGQTRTVTLENAGDGMARAVITAAEDGLWQVQDGTHTAYVMPRPIAPAELADLRASDTVLAPMVEASGGSQSWLTAGLPDIRRVAADRRAEGRGWIGLVQNDAYTVTGASRIPLLPAWLALSLLLAATALAWWREGRS